jgi:NAD(P)-dependent dehydrogenase (short-subunit alcohol dehydrogenase family)
LVSCPAGKEPERLKERFFVNLDELMAMYDFTGKTFAVTGGAGALGSDVVVALAGCGASVMILDLRLGGVPMIRERLGHRASQVEALKVDVMDRDSLMSAGTAINDSFGGLYGLVNAAGGNSPQATVSPDMTFFDIPEEGMRFVLDLNLLGTIMPCQILTKPMVEAGEGVILNYSSMNAFRPLTNIAAYSASKAGVTNFTAWLAVHMAENHGNIRVNAIAPGFFLGEQNRFLLLDKETGKLTPRGNKIIEHTPMGRFGVPEDLLGTVLWLLSPASSFVTGITVPVDGGFSACAGV